MRAALPAVLPVALLALHCHFAEGNHPNDLDPTCANNIMHSSGLYCCNASCGTCGGSGCGGRPGGSEHCCTGGIEANRGTCSRTAPGCKITPPDVLCLTGLKNGDGDICCEDRCGSCGGSGCGGRPGGANSCCGSNIRDHSVSCAVAGPPCVIPADTDVPTVLNQGGGGRGPSLSPTASPSNSPGCPITLSVASLAQENVQCRCDILDGSTVPFNDVAHTYCPGSMPSAWTGAVHFTCPHCFHLGTQFNFSCPNSWDACDIYLLAYHCPGCASSGFNGGWVQNLGAEWSPKRCAPKFCEDGNQSLAHNMLAFNRQVASGAPVELPATTTSRSYYFSMVIKEIPAVCSDFADGTACANAPGGGCVWENGACVNAFCPPIEGSSAQCGPPCPPEDCRDTIPPVPPDTGAPQNVRAERQTLAPTAPPRRTE